MLNIILSLIFLCFFAIALYIKFNEKNASLIKSRENDFEVVITSLDEDEGLVIRTIRSWKKTGKKIYLLRDGKTSKELKKFLKENDVELVITRKDGKAGAINNYVNNYAKKDYFFIVDVDEELVNLENLKHLSSLKGDVLVSKKEFFENDFLSSIFNLTNNIFTTIQNFMNKGGEAFFNGSCSLIRKEVVQKVPFRNLKIEDIDFSLRAITNGFSIKFVDKEIAKGKKPSFISFVRQHARYAYGVGELIEENYSIIKNNKNLLFTLLFMPLLSFFQIIVVFYTFFSFDFSVILLELFLSYIIYILYLHNFNPIKFFFVFLLNFFLLPLIRVYYFVLGLLRVRKSFSTTL